MSSSTNAEVHRSLRTAELFVLCCLRLIAKDPRADGETFEDLVAGFKAGGLAEDHALQFQKAVQLINTAGGGRLPIGPAANAQIGCGDKLMLQLLMLLQHGNAFAARRILWGFVAPDVARKIVLALEGLAFAMARAGLNLPETPYLLPVCPAETLAARQMGLRDEPKTHARQWLN